MIPVVALVGRPNVGKSTLFNYLTKTNDALVADYPGLTRDRQYGQASWLDNEFIVIDTGGIEEEDKSVHLEVTKQAHLAIEESDLVVFMVDAQDGLTSVDLEIASILRKINKPVVVALNKIDGVNKDSVIAEFYSLSLGEVYGISASKGIATSKFIENAIMPSVEHIYDLEETEDSQISSMIRLDNPKRAIKLALVGKPNVGKSTLTNRMLGDDRVVVYDLPGTTRDSIYIPMSRGDDDYVLIDTAGVRKKAKVNEAIEKFSIIKTLKAIKDANVVLLVIDAHEGINVQDLSLLRFILDAGRSLVIAVNKWDGLDIKRRDEIKDELEDRLGFINFARIHFISALHGSGVGNLFESIKEAYECALKSYSTPKLTDILKQATQAHEPPMVAGRRIKLKYAHLGGQNPPIFVIHGNLLKNISESYTRYLTNFFRKELGIMGTPLKIKFQTSDNPYKDRINKLTPRQEYK
ncbi:MAG: ribosome biogenesis GTPase Der, partial [Psittacicella sp.]